MARRPLDWKVVEHMSHIKFLNWGVILVEDDHGVIHVDNSSDLALFTSLNDLKIMALHIDGQSIDVDAPSDIIDVDEDDDIIDEEDPIPRDLADSDDENLVNLDIDDGMLHGVTAGDCDGVPVHFGSWCSIPSERKAGVLGKIRVKNPDDETYDIEAIRSRSLANISVKDWDADEFLLPEDFSTASEERFPLLRKSSYCNIVYMTPCPIKGFLRSDLDTMSLDDLYHHLKVYKPEVQKKLDSQNMAFISLAKNNSGNGEVNTASIPTASTQVSPANANVAAASISLDTACAYTASQSSGSQIKYEDINQIDEDDIKKMDIKWSTLTATRWATLLGSAGHPGAKIGSYMANEEEDYALVADQEAPTEFALMAKSSSDTEGIVVNVVVPPYTDYNIVCFAHMLTALFRGPHVKTF
uniref:Uncharacterized protein n=1 Tax=Tanacetum cinerariifolium TaxID=118510 RepID=A0A6L2MWF4_TANCI|nr:hypothetical protein [Tanacetum cinerariifolium]